MKKNLFTIITIMLFSLPCSAMVDIKFTPSNDCENTIITYIDNSQNHIDIAIYSINNNQIVNALKRAHKRGVKIRILTDKLQAASKSSKVVELYKYGINIRVNSKHKIEHNKFAIYDKQSASSGSFNWTNPASTKNSENCIFITNNTSAIDAYLKRFEYLWQINTKEKSDKWFKQKI